MATSIKLDDALKNRVQDLASRRDRSAHWIMREAIRHYVEQEEARESVRAEAIESWSAFQETGRHLTGEETIAWLSTWGSEAESARPPCHD